MPQKTLDFSAKLEPIRAQYKLPAIAGAAWQNGELVAIGATGVRASGEEERVTLDDPWHLGSNTKAMTAVLVALYIDRNKLHFEDTLGVLFSGESIHPDFAKVTIEQLLQHRGGLPHDVFVDGSADARAKVVRILLARAPAQAPGTYTYSNAGYVTLGVVLERLTGKSWEELMRTELFGPLHMERCGFGAPTGPAPRGHREGTPVDPSVGDNPPALGPAGTVHCSLRDWGKFVAVVLAGARGEGSFVTPETMKRLLVAPEDPKPEGRYAGGWATTSRDWAGGTALMHMGSNTLWTAIVWIAPAKNAFVVAASNTMDPRGTDAALAPFALTIR